MFNFIYISAMKVFTGFICGGIYYLYMRIIDLESRLEEIKEIVDDHEDYIYKLKRKKL